MSVFDGTTGTYGSFCDLEEEQHIVDMLNRVAAVKAENWTPELIKFPAYGFEIGSKDGNGYRAFWSDGYLVMRDGSVYKFDFDFAKIWNEHEWRELYKVDALAEMPAGRYLAQNENGWIAENMSLANELTGPAYITMKCIEWTDEIIRYELENKGSADWMYGDTYSLEVMLDGNWYSVPMNCDLNYSFKSIANYLKPGETVQGSVSFTGDHPYYSNLPKGRYRLVIEGVAMEAGEIRETVSDEMDSLMEKFPEYFGLSTAKGLEVYVWQMGANSYYCGVMGGTNRTKSLEELMNLKAATIDEMKAILSTYDIAKENIIVSVWQNPISSYLGEYWIVKEDEDPDMVEKRRQEYTDMLREMIIGGK